METTHNIFLNPKDLVKTSTATGWKKYPEPKIDIVFGNSFDANTKIQLDN